MYFDNKILMGKNLDSNKEFYLLPKMANRHGLIAGGTGSGKTITLKVMAESFSNAGVPSLLADVKGDISGMIKEGIDSEDMQKRIKKFGLNDYGFKYQKFPTNFFEIERKKGLPVRTTISRFGPVLLSHVLSLNQTQADILNIIFKIADDNGLLLLDLKDLKKMLEFIIENIKEIGPSYGNITKPSVQSIQRALVSLEQEGIDKMFGEPELEISDLIKTDNNGRGFINILHSEALILSPRVYSAFMLWLLCELYESMPEVGDLDKPKIVFFFDEAHLLFKDCTPVLLKKIDQMAKLIRSKGIGLYFITQDPTDIPGTILQQLGNKVQHVFRAYTAKDKKNQKAIADSFRINPDLNLTEVLDNLGTGESIVSFLDEKGIPNMVEFAKILPPQSMMGIITDEERQNAIKSSELYLKYKDDLDRESAYEILANESSRMSKMDDMGIKDLEAEKQRLKEEKTLLKEQEKYEKQLAKEKQKQATRIGKSISNVAKSAGSTIGREVAQTLATSIFGNSKAGKRIAGNLGSSLGRNILGTFLK